ncbi:MAG: ABC transporter permease [Campylobacteraceae bacterium]|jgi:ABC-2 type transport system permease protein|nr:ABC transporter permease [Campylobacteraceae bacterium]
MDTKMDKRRIKALIQKESLQMTRDPSTLLIAFILPLLLLFLMGYAVSLDAKNISIGIISKSQSSDARTLVESFRGSTFFIVTEGKDKELFKEMMQQGSIKAFLEIDEEFGRENTYKIQLLIDSVEPNLAGFIQKYANGVISLWAKQNNILTAYETKIESRYWFNPPISSIYFLIPGSIVVVVTMIGTLLTSLVVAREWERGTMEAIMATPTSMLEIIIGKIIPYFILAMWSLLLCCFIAYFWYEVPLRGSLLMLLLMGAIYLFPALTSGLLISTLTKNQFIAAQISLVTSFLPAYLLSGFLFEIENMPNWLQVATHIVPARYFVNSIQTLFLAGNVYEIFLTSILGITAVGIILFLAVFIKLRKGLE